MEEGFWGAYPKQPVRHFLLGKQFAPVHTTLCGQRWIGSRVELTPDDLTHQRLCKACQREIGRMAKTGKVHQNA